MRHKRGIPFSFFPQILLFSPRIPPSSLKFPVFSQIFSFLPNFADFSPRIPDFYLKTRPFCPQIPFLSPSSLLCSPKSEFCPKTSLFLPNFFIFCHQTHLCAPIPSFLPPILPFLSPNSIPFPHRFPRVFIPELLPYHISHFSHKFNKNFLFLAPYWAGIATFFGLFEDPLRRIRWDGGKAGRGGILGRIWRAKGDLETLSGNSGSSGMKLEAFPELSGTPGAFSRCPGAPGRIWEHLGRTQPLSMVPERPLAAVAPRFRLGGSGRKWRRHGAPPDVTSVRSGSGLRRERRLERPEGTVRAGRGQKGPGGDKRGQGGDLEGRGRDPRRREDRESGDGRSEKGPRGGTGRGSL